MNQTLQISQIKINEQPRKDFSDVDEIAASIEKVGLLQPVAVRKENDEYVLVDGEQRLRAFKKLKRSEIPVYFVTPADEQIVKESQMMANLMRSDLAYIERCRGFAALLVNAPAKYNTLVIANKFGLKEKEVKDMVSVAGKLDPKVDVALASGQFNDEDIEELAKIPKEYQEQVAKSSRGNVRGAIFRMTEELYFDEVFGKSQAEAAGKVHYAQTYGNPRTFDKTYAAQVKKDFEARTKKKYEAERAKEKKKEGKQRELSKEQKEKIREKKKADAAAAIKAIREGIPAWIKRSAAKVDLAEIVKREARNFSTNELRIILRAFEFKKDVNEMDSESLRRAALNEIFLPAVKTPEQLANYIEFVHSSRPYQCNTEEFAKTVSKSNSSINQKEKSK